MAASSGDPRPARSRARLLEAATALLRAGWYPTTIGTVRTRIAIWSMNIPRMM